MEDVWDIWEKQLESILLTFLKVYILYLMCYYVN